MKYRRNYKGGNLSGNNLDKLPIQTSPNAKYSSAKYEVINTNELIKNYGSVYKSTGGGVSTNKAYKFVYKFIDNRVLDIYLKYLGITTLTPTTLVPLALIAGQDAFKHFLKEMNRKNQVGGQIPIIDNSLIGPFLKIAGISQLNCAIPSPFLTTHIKKYLFVSYNDSIVIHVICLPKPWLNSNVIKQERENFPPVCVDLLFHLLSWVEFYTQSHKSESNIYTLDLYLMIRKLG